MDFFTKHGIEKFTNEERELLELFPECISKQQIDSIEKIGHIPTPRHATVLRSFANIFFGSRAKKVIAQDIENALKDEPKKKHIEEFRTPSKKGKLILASHHVIISDSVFISKMLEMLGLVDLKHSYPIFVQRLMRTVKFTGISIPLIDPTAHRDVIKKTKNKNFNKENVGKLVKSINEKMHKCVNFLLKEGKIIVQYPEGKLRQAVTQKGMDTRLRLDILDFLDSNSYDLYILSTMDDTEQYGKDAQKKYKAGNRTFDILKVDPKNSNLEEIVERHLNMN